MSYNEEILAEMFRLPKLSNINDKNQSTYFKELERVFSKTKKSLEYEDAIDMLGDAEYCLGRIDFHDILEEKSKLEYTVSMLLNELYNRLDEEEKEVYDTLNVTRELKGEK